ncbi:hypothetical protein Ato02nite_086150 [Paractinoplanes toevensis]|uniref:DUF11 domain-containing protein n=1 Tax=Paractinoplanes toevensis TaxID=571911 RepID=A0A920BPJ9_9ACTN|nr:hypothetical protein Ato02nite_086150 [Actinoplanes toevensis]
MALLAVLLPASPAAALTPVAAPTADPAATAADSVDLAVTADSVDVAMPAADSVDLAVTAADSADPAEVGSTVTYSAVVKNNGPVFATGVEVTVAVSGADHVVRSASGGTGPCFLDASVATCTISSILAGATAKVQIMVTPQAAGTISARVTAATGEQTDSTPSNNAATETTVVNARPSSTDLAVTTTGPAGSVQVGAGYQYQAVVTNNGPDAATGVKAVVTLTGADRTIQAAAVGTGACSISAPRVNCEIGALAEGASTTVTVTVLPRATGSITATAEAGVATGDAVPGNNTAKADTVIAAAPAPPSSADLAVTVAGTRAVALAGTFAVTGTVSNRGPSAAAAVTATVALTGAPSLILGVTSSRGTCAATGSTVRCEVGNLTRNARATITVTVEPQALGAITTTATVSAVPATATMPAVPATAMMPAVPATATAPADPATATAPADPVTANNTAVRNTTVDNRLGCTIVGTAGNNVLIGGPGRDVICPLGGDDTVNASAGNDIVHGGSGNDIVQAGTGHDTIYGGLGNDTLTGGPGFDRLDGGPGADICTSGEIVVSCR